MSRRTFGTGPGGMQLFTMDLDGRRQRQLTAARGFTVEGGVTHVELASAFATPRARHGGILEF